MPFDKLRASGKKYNEIKPDTARAGLVEALFASGMSLTDRYCP
jgi:hypothetical protein